MSVKLQSKFPLDPWCMIIESVETVPEPNNVPIDPLFLRIYHTMPYHVMPCPAVPCRAIQIQRVKNR